MNSASAQTDRDPRIRANVTRRQAMPARFASGLRSGIVSYAVDGKQFILVPSGRGSFAATLLPALFPEMVDVPGAATLIAFTLD